ncbi:hypothetical protein OC846_003201 [Tilletia horrida]|uniref:BZIP domain-containing protein n=1 Tax=Tilletia horrida TaxID=155126 RepID=A0AAN6JU65_9BASI|nr:hypothetical protein OC846_003201 [Tilletia horrida]KAK0569678.1 hypothetical protein OC861_000638 [Tilletia horrida]
MAFSFNTPSAQRINTIQQQQQQPASSSTTTQQYFHSSTLGISSSILLSQKVPKVQPKPTLPGSSVFQLRHFYSAIQRAKALQQQRPQQARAYLQQQQRYQQEQYHQHSLPVSSSSSSNTVSAPTQQELESFLSAIYSMTGQASSITTPSSLNNNTSQTNNNNIIMTTNSMESDFPLAPVELPSWMLKDGAFSQTAAAALAAASAVSSDPATSLPTGATAAAVGAGVETSPVWSSFGDDFSGSDQDPSPALSDSLTFDELLSSCDPSPLLVDDLSYGGVGSGLPNLSDIPLFGNFDPSLLKEDHYHNSKSKANVSASAAAAAAAGPIGFSDFTLFPPTHLPASTTTTSAPSLHSSTISSTASLIAPNTSPAASMQLAFGSSTPPGPEAEDPAQLLLRALTAAAAAQQQQSPSAVQSTSPVLMHTVASVAPQDARPVLSTSSSSSSSGFSFTSPTTAPTPAPVSGGNKRSSTRKTSVIGVKRRADAAELLPLDAPIQSRTYKTASATSRKDASIVAAPRSTDGHAAANDDDDAAPSPAPAAEDVIPEGLSAMESKRLSNTLAARRSRHRKAEELRILHETIASLKEEVQEWKRRCMRAENERDEIAGRLEGR